MNNQAQLIALDWGTSSLRAYLLDAEGRILQQRQSLQGILQVKNGDFAHVYLDICGSWLQECGPMPAIASGMIGSRQGWSEAPYVAAPATLAMLASNMIRLDLKNNSSIRDLAIHIVPGVSCVSDEGHPEVMRGEETQLLGAIDGRETNGDAIYILPGTHSKWVSAGPQGIGRFSTFMTGEIFALLKSHSTLGRLMAESDGVQSDHVFLRGVEASRQARSATLLNRLFSVRTLGLFKQIEPRWLASYLSGLLIGEEIREASELGYCTGMRQTVTVIGDSGLTALYCAALNLYKLCAKAVSPEIVVQGLSKLAVAADLMESK